MKYTRKLFGKRLKSLRLDLGFSQSFVAESIKVEQSTLSMFEKGTGGLEIFILLLNFYGSYHKVSAILLEEFIVLRKDQNLDQEENQTKVVSEINEIEKYLKSKILNLKLLASGVRS